MQLKPNPTVQLILEATGGSGPLIEATHHGLYETPLGAFYPVLNLNEVIAFSASSWRHRSEHGANLLPGRAPSEIYTIFSEILRDGMPWYNTNSNVTPENRKLYDALNPFVGRNLQRRLASVREPDVVALIERMNEPVKKHVFECNYAREKRLAGGDNSGLVVMRYQTVYPRKGKVVPAFAAEVSRIIRSYPRSYMTVDELPELKLPEGQQVLVQGDLFEPHQ